MSGGDGEREAILAKIKAQGDIVRKLKEQKAEKDQVGSGKAIDLLMFHLECRVPWMKG